MRKSKKTSKIIFSFILCFMLVVSLVTTAFAINNENLNTLPEPSASAVAEPSPDVTTEPGASATTAPLPDAAAEPSASVPVEPSPIIPNESPAKRPNESPSIEISEAIEEKASIGQSIGTELTKEELNKPEVMPGGGYYYDESSKTLNVMTNAGTTAWKTDASIDSNAIENLVVAGQVTAIGSNAFNGCSNLKSAVIQEGVTDIGSYAFVGTKISTITLPQTIRTIGSGAFGYSALTYIVIPEGVTDIPSSAFKDCHSLISVSLPQSLANLHIAAFQNCSALKSVIIPENVTVMGDYVFDACISLESVYMRSSTPVALKSNTFRNASSDYKIYVPTGALNAYLAAWPTQASHLFESLGYEYDEASGTLTILSDAGMNAWLSDTVVDREKIQQVVIKTGVTSIAANAFADCSNLSSVNIPNTVTLIGDSAFSACASLKSVNIPSSVTSIGQYAFSTSGLESVVIPGSVLNVGESAFATCPSLSNVTLMNGVQVIGDNAFSLCPIKSIIFPESIKTIGNSVFSRCSLLTGVSMEGSTPATIGTGVFYGTHLYMIFVPQGTVNTYKTAWTEYQSYITDASYFYNEQTKSLLILTNEGTTEWRDDSTIDKSQVADVTIFDSVTAIGDFAFQNCVNLSYVSIPKSVTDIGAYAFAGSGINIIALPEGIKTIETGTFEKCTALSSVAIPSSVETINQNAFASCVNLLAVDFSENLAVVQDNAFAGCSSLDTIFVERLVPATIGTDIFLNLPDYFNIYVPEGTASNYKATVGWINYAKHIVEAVSGYSYDPETNTLSIFSNEGSLAWRDDSSINADDIEVIMISEKVTKIEDNAFTKCVNLEYVAISSSVLSIGQGAFSSCVALSAVIIPDNVTEIEDYAFAGCSELDIIYVNSSIPSAFGQDVFLNLPDNFKIFVPDGRAGAYKAADGWKNYAQHIAEFSLGYSFDYSTKTLTVFTNEATFSWRNDNTFGADDIEAVVITEGVTTIEYGAFGKCINLKQVTVADTVSTIRQSAFASCVSLEKITIPASVKSIEDYAFAGCSSLKEIIVNRKTPAFLGQDVFLNLPATFKIYVPKNTANTYKAAEGWKNYKEHIVDDPTPTPTPAPVPANAHTISASAGAHGTISAFGNVLVEDGNSFTFYFTPDANYRVNKVIVDGNAVKTDGKTYTFYQVRSDHTIKVEFAGVNSPKTGDTTSLTLYVVLLIAVICTIIVLIIFLRKRKNARYNK